jgi:DNA-binding NtrC family response regulator
MTALRGYHSPGNARELENIVERAVVLTRATRIGLDDLPPNVVDPVRSRGAGGGAGAAAAWRPGAYVPRPLRIALEEPERLIILQALEANSWNRQKTADDLEINRTTLYKKMKAYGLDQ